MWRNPKFPWMVLRDNEPDDGGLGGDDPGEQTPIDNPPNPNPNLGDLQEGIDDPFADTPFAGMSAQEVTERMGVLEGTVREQGRALNDMSRRAQQPSPSPSPELEPDEPIDAQSFFSDPDSALKKRDERLANKIKKDMQEMLSPFAASITDNAVKAAWASLADNYENVNVYRALIQTTLDEMGITEPNYDTLELLYLKEVGRAAVTGKQPNNNDNGNPPPRRSPPPQHPASNQPPPSDGGRNKARELTENEKKLARVNGMSDAEYLAWLDETDENVINSKVGVKE